MDFFGSKLSETADLIVVNKVRQHGSSGHKFYDFLGVYDSEEKAKEQMHFYEETNPATSDYPYHFEIIKCPLNHVGKDDYPTYWAH